MIYDRHPARKGRIYNDILRLIAVFCIAVVAGCTVGPDFQRPSAQVPDKWAGPTTDARWATPAEEALALWWTVFQDPTLTSLVERAVQSNLDLMNAGARIRQARAVRGVAVSGMGPTVDATGSYQRNRSPVTTSVRTGGRGAQDNSTEGVITNQYQAGFDAGWELDIFGGVRRGIEAAEADLQAAIEDRRDVLVTLTAEVASNYISLRTFQQRISIAQNNLRTQEHSARLTRERFRGGFVSGLDVANAEAQVATTAAQIPLLEASARQTIYSLSILMALEPAALIRELSPASVIPVAPPSVPVGVPSDLLLRRPDIRRAEAAIHAATARIGVATADLFPRFTLSGSLGLQASTLSSLEWVNRFWSLGPSLSWPVFDTGRIRSNIEQQNAIQEQELIAYRRTVLTALQEVENALIASAKEEEHRKALDKAVTANRKAVELAKTLYTEGQTDFLNVLEAQRSLYSSEDAFIQSIQNVSTHLVALYKALGGGWKDDRQ